MNESARDIEAYLFMRGGSVEKTEILELFDLHEEALIEALNHVEQTSKGRGVVLVQTPSAIELRTAPESSGRLEALRKEELNHDIGRASLEVLAVTLYRGASTRSEIDRIRGVNSTTALRNLLLRGLLDRIPNPKDERQHLYRATTEALAHLGFSRVEDIPDYEKTKEEISLLEEKLRIKSGIPEVTP